MNTTRITSSWLNARLNDPIVREQIIKSLLGNTKKLNDEGMQTRRLRAFNGAIRELGRWRPNYDINTKEGFDAAATEIVGGLEYDVTVRDFVATVYAEHMDHGYTNFETRWEMKAALEDLVSIAKTLVGQKFWC